MLSQAELPVWLLLLAATATASVFSGAESLCSLAECECSTAAAICRCQPDSSFQVSNIPQLTATGVSSCISSFLETDTKLMVVWW